MEYNGTQETDIEVSFGEANLSGALPEIAAAAAASVRAGAIPLIPDAANTIVLPEGATIDDIKVQGRDLVIQLDDGRVYVIADGAIFVPQIVAQGVTVPPLNLAALLIGQEPEPAAGPVRSSGGNFAVPVDPLQAAYDLGDLLPYTELSFPEPRQREIFPAEPDEEPTTIIITPDQPSGAVSATASVNEAGLPARGGEPAGSNAAASSETTTGTIAFASPDGLASITLNGTAITAVGQTFTTPRGVLTITSIAPGSYGYSYTLTDNTNANVNPMDVFAVVVTDSDGDVASANLTISIIDDVPTARNDTDAVAAGTYGPETGNVLTGTGTTSGAAGADTPGADGATLNGVRAGTTGSFVAAGSTVAGTYGTLTLGANGSYSYVRNPGTPGGVTDTFSYQIVDGDGDVSTATLVISIGDSPATVISVPGSDGGTIVNESGLPPRGSEPEGSNAPAPIESTTGTITVTAPDGIASVQINGTTVTGPGQVIAMPTGTFTIVTYNPATGAITYTFTLTDNTSGNTTVQPVTVTVTDVDGDTDSETFNITIVDDVPTARADVDAVAAGSYAPATGNVITDAEADGGVDTPGADGVTVTSISGTAAGTVGGTTAGTYGVLTLNADGSYSYVRNPGTPGGVTDTFTYTITDGDGDTSTTTLTITIADSPTSLDLPVKGEAGTEVLEAALASGSNPDSTAETTAATITYVAPDGPATVTIDGVAVTAVGQTYTGSYGTLTITSIVNGAIGYSYTLTTKTSGDATFDDFAVVVTDQDGDATPGTLTIDIVDDVPMASDDTDSIASGLYGPATGNVITDAEADGGKDTAGADGVTVTAVTGAAAGTVGGTTAGTYGLLTLNADGSYSYARNPGTPGGVSDSFTYTITDGDGDADTAVLTITIADSPTTLDLPVKGEAGTQVNEAGLPARGAESQGSGEEAAAGADGDPSEATSGTISYTAPDGPATVTIGGTAVTAVGQTFAGAYGTLTITGIAPGAITYTYVLADNTAGDATTDTFTVVVTDKDGDNTPGTLTIDIVDDVPTARNDADSVTEDQFVDQEGNPQADGHVILGVGGVDTNLTDGTADTQGADGATVTAVAFGAAAGVVDGDTAGEYGTLVLGADGNYTYTLNNFDPRVQGLDGNDTLSETFTYTITDGDGDPSTATLTITINGADDPITIGGLNVDGPELIVDEDDLSDGSDTAPKDSLTQSGTFTVNGTDGIVGVQLAGSGVNVSVGQTFTSAFGTFTVTSISGPLDGSATALTIGYSYTLTDNTGHPNALDQNFITETFAIAVTDTDGSTDAATIEVRVVDDVPTANPDGVFTVAEQTPRVIDALFNDVKGADGVTLSTGVVIATLPTKGTVVYNGDGTFTYTPNNGAEGADSFTYTIKDADGDESTATVTLNLLADSEPQVVSTTNLTVDEDGFGNANVDAAPLQGTPTETDSTESLTASGTALVNFGADVPADLAASIVLLDSAALDTQLKTLDGNAVTFGLEGGALIGRDSKGGLVVTITLTTAATGPTPGDVTYGYTAVLAQPVKHVTAGGEDTVTLTGVTFDVTDSDGDHAQGSFSVAIVDDVPSLDVAKGDDAGIVLETQDADTIGAASDTAVTSAAFNSAFSLTSTIGADGGTAPALSYALAVTSALSGLKSHGEDITLTLSGGKVVGSTATGGAIFDIAVSATGVVTLTQYQQIDQPIASDPAATDAPFADHLVTLANGLVTLTASSSVTDRDGDTASDSEVIDLGGNVQFADHGPTLTNPELGSSVILDETTAGTPTGFGALGISATSFEAIVMANADFGADGQAASGATTYALSLTGDGSTALQTAIGDLPIVLTLSADKQTVTGTYSGGTAFTVTLLADGRITVTQFVPLEHNTDGTFISGAHDDALTLAGLINATITVKDFDGDTASETVAIGGNITFKDDGPSVDVTAGADAGITLQTFDAGTDGSPTDQNSATSAAAFGAVLARTFTTGADGAATPTLNYALSTSGGDSLLDSHGVSINLFLIGGKVVGSTSTTLVGVTTANTVFDVAVDTAGVVTLTQYQQIDHPVELTTTSPFNDQLASLVDSAVRLTASANIIDNDGDTASDSATVNIGANLRFADDGPDIAAALLGGVTIRIDETDNVVAAGGETDAPGGNLGTVMMTAASLFTVSNVTTSADADTTLSYTLKITEGAPSGLLLSTTNTAIVLHDAGGGLIEGRVGTTAGAIAFTVSINPTSGAVTLTQFLAVEHPTGGASYDEDSTGLNPGALQIEVKATDFDGDTDTALVDLGSIIRFEDDGPTLNVAKSDDAAIVLATQDGETIGAGVQDTAVSAAAFGSVFTLTSNGGSDGAATPALSYALAVTGALSGLKSHGEDITLALVGTKVVGSTTTGGAIFDIAVSSTGVVTVTQYQQIDHLTTDPSPTGSPFTDHQVFLANGLVTLTASATITDNDGDTMSDSEVIDLGGNIRFDDHGPDIAATLVGGAAIRIDETDGVVAAGGETDAAGGNLGTVTMTAASLFTISNLVTSADAPTTFAYTLKFTEGADSGLDLSTTNTSIFLFTNTTTGAVEGRVGGSGGAVAFSIAINLTNGAVTLTQFLAVEHPTGGNATFDEDSTGLTSGVLQIEVKATDFDGDTDTATVDLGSIIRFEDDGPSVSANAAIQLDDDNVGANGNPAGTGDDALSAVLSGTLGHSFGSDGGSIAWQSFSTTGGAPGTFVYDTATVPGSLLVKQDGVTIFTVTLDAATGAYTVTQNNPLKHASGSDENNQNFVLTYRVTDNDGDYTDGTLTINVDDDTPTALAGTSTGSVDEEGLAGNAGGPADDLAGEATTTSGSVTSLFASGADVPLAYSLINNAAALTAQNLTSGGVALSYVITSTTITASAGITPVFTFTLNPGGTWDFAQLKALDHAAGLTENDITIQFGSLIRATDADGDFVNAIGTVSVVVDDDTPTLTIAAPDPVTSRTATGDFALSIGADKHPAGTALDSYVDVVLQGGTVGGQPITVTSVGPLTTTTNTASLVTYAFTFTYDGDTATGNQPIANSGTLSLNTTTGEYTVTVANPIQVSNTVQTNSNSVVRTTFDNEDNPGVSSGPEVTVAQMLPNGTTPNFFVQFSGQHSNSDAGFTYSGGLFGGPDGYVSVSGNSNGVNSDTLAQNDVLNLNFFTQNPGGDLSSPTEPRAFAEAIFLQIDQFGNSEDLVVVLKLEDPNNPGTVITRTFVADNSDFYTNATGSPTGYNFTLDNDDAVLVIEANDYRIGLENYQIVGVQIVTSTQNTSGTAYDLNGLVGTSGGLIDTSPNPFVNNGATDDNDVTKIVNIGFKLTQSNPQPLTLNFAVTASDADQDSTGSVPLSVTYPASVMPIVLDLDGDGAEFLGTAAGVTFDYAGDGSAEATAWVAADDGLLALDGNGNGKVDGGSEIVFGSGDVTDLEGVAAKYDDNHDGVLDAQDAAFASFGVWQDADSDGVSDAGEFRSLTELGIASINLTSDGKAYAAANGDVTVYGTGTYTRADGTTGKLADAAFATGTAQQLAAMSAAASGLLAAVAADAATTATAPAAQPTTGETGGSAGAPAATLETADTTAVSTSKVGAEAGASDAGVASATRSSSYGNERVELAQAEDHDTAAVVGNDADKSALFDFGNHGSAAMDALLAVGQGPAAEAGAVQQALPAVAEALADATGNGVVDSIVEYFVTDHDGAATTQGASDFALKGLLDMTIGGTGQDNAGPHYNAMTALDHDQAAALA